MRPDSPSFDENSATRTLGVAEPATFTETAALLDRARQGNETAFAALWQRYAPGLHALITGKVWKSLGPTLRPRLLADAEDILVDVMDNAARNLASFQYQGSRSFLAWLCRIAQNELTNRIKYWRTGQRDVLRERPPCETSSTSAAGQGPSRVAAGSTGLVTALVRDENRTRVARALASLDERNYTIIYWRFYAGASWNEIAEMTNAPSADAARMECFNHSLPALAAELAALGSA